MRRLCGSSACSPNRAWLTFIATDPRAAVRRQAAWAKVTTASHSIEAVRATLVEVSRNPIW
jgi:hypothetical protein